MNRIIMEYNGKKVNIVLSMNYLKERYIVEGPRARISFNEADALAILSENPKMFTVVGVGRPDKPVEASILATAPIPTEQDMLKDDENQDLPGGDYKVDNTLTGDGIEGEDAPETGEGKQIPGNIAVQFVPCQVLPMSELTGLKVPELRKYILDRFGVECSDDEKRATMLKTIKTMEATFPAA